MNGDLRLGYLGEASGVMVPFASETPTGGYRVIFWAVAEDRDALLDPESDPGAADRYRDHFSSARTDASPDW